MRQTNTRWQRGEIVRLPVFEGGVSRGRFPSGDMVEAATSDNGGSIVRLTRNIYRDMAPRYAPGGPIRGPIRTETDIYFLQNSGGGYNLSAVPPTGSRIERAVTQGYDFIPGAWSFSPDD